MRDLTFSDGTSVSEEIRLRYYSDSWRVFHDWQHIENGLDFFETHFSDTQYTKTILLAWFLHDAIYIPGYTGNEEASAALVPYYAGRIGFSDTDIADTQALIMQTKGHKPLIDLYVPGADIINDMDLHGMGSPLSYSLNGKMVTQEIKNFKRSGNTHWTLEDEIEMLKGNFNFLLSYRALFPHLFKTEIGLTLQPTALELINQDIDDCAKLLAGHNHPVLIPKFKTREES